MRLSGYGSKSLRELLHGETVRSGRALEEDLAISSNQIETIRPGGVSSLRLVRDAVQKRRDADTQLPDARGSRFIPLAIGSWGRQHHAIPNIRSKLPEVGRMRFLYVS